MLLVSTECPSCYGGIQEDVHSLREQVADLAVRLKQLQIHPVMLLSQTFVKRLEETAQAVWALVQKTSAVQDKDRASKEEWGKLNITVVRLNDTLNDLVGTVVKGVLGQTGSVRDNHEEITNVMANVQTMIISGFRLLQLAMRRDLDRAKGKVEGTPWNWSELLV